MRLRVAIALLALGLCACPAPVIRQGPGPQLDSERKLGREFAVAAARSLIFIDDDAVISLIDDLTHEIIKTRGKTPFDYHVFVVKDASLNAFAVPGGYVYLHSGLIAAAGSVDEVAGVLAHEIAHVEGHHFMRRYQDTWATSLGAAAASILALIFLPAKEGAAAAMAAQAASLQQQLNYTRRMEEEADIIGMKMAAEAGFETQALADFLGRVRTATMLPGYLFTHPLPEDRIARITGLQRNFPPGKPTSSERELAFKRAQAIARARTYGVEGVVREYTQYTEASPEDPAQWYLLGSVFEVIGNAPRAVEAHEKAAALAPENTAFAAARGRALSAAGRTEEARAVLEAARAKAPEDSEIALALGRVHLEAEKPALAVPLLQAAVARMPNRWRLHHALGLAYGGVGRDADGHYELGRAFHLRWDFQRAQIHYSQALQQSRVDPKRAEELRGLLEDVSER